MRIRAIMTPAHLRRDQTRALVACGRDCHDNRRWMRPQPSEAAHLADEVAHARELTDLERVEHDGFGTEVYLTVRESWDWSEWHDANLAPWPLEYADIAQAMDEASAERYDELDALMREPMAVSMV